MRKITFTFPENYVKPELPGGLLWVAELRSGKYPQGRGRLCDKNGYCCLGVLVKTQGRLKQGMGDYFYDENINSIASLSSDNPLTNLFGSFGRIPKGVRVFADGLLFVPNEKGEMEDCYLTEFNDEGYFTFEEIATIIENVWDCK